MNTFLSLPRITVFASSLSENVPIQSSILKTVIEESFDILGQSAKTLIMDYLTERGLDLEDKEKSYSLNIIRQMILETFDEETAEILLVRMKQVLKKHNML